VIVGYVLTAGAVLLRWLDVVSGIIADCDRCAVARGSHPLGDAVEGPGPEDLGDGCPHRLRRHPFVAPGRILNCSPQCPEWHHSQRSGSVSTQLNERIVPARAHYGIPAVQVAIASSTVHGVVLPGHGTVGVVRAEAGVIRLDILRERAARASLNVTVARRLAIDRRMARGTLLAPPACWRGVSARPARPNPTPAGHPAEPSGPPDGAAKASVPAFGTADRHGECRSGLYQLRWDISGHPVRLWTTERCCSGILLASDSAWPGTGCITAEATLW
jgi:hypothetical protein